MAGRRIRGANVVLTRSSLNSPLCRRTPDPTRSKAHAARGRIKDRVRTKHFSPRFVAGFFYWPKQVTLCNPEQECSLAMPRGGIGWDVFCWIGQRRFSRHWSVPQIRHELRDTYDLRMSDDAIEGESFVIKPQLVQNRCVQIGCLSAVGDGSIAEIIGGPVSLPAANATTGKPDAEAVRMMITSLNAGDLVCHRVVQRPTCD